MIERVIPQNLLSRLRIGLAVLPFCIVALSNSLAQERLDHANPPPAAAGSNSDMLMKLPAVADKGRL